MRALRRLSGLLVLVAGLAGQALAAPIVSPPGLAPGALYRLAFVTSSTHDAMSDDIATYNAFVTAQAAASPELNALATSWSVLASTAAVDARDNSSTNPFVTSGVPIYNLNGELVAADYADLWDGSLVNAIHYDQTGALHNGLVYTGTASDGIGITDRELAAIGYRVQYGFSSFTQAGWIDNGDWAGASGQAYYYGISGVLGEAVMPVPLPPAVVLLALGVPMLWTRRLH